MLAITPQGAVPTPDSDNAESRAANFERLSNELKRAIEDYERAKARARLFPENMAYQADFANAVERLRPALREAGKAHPDQKTGKKWIERARKLSVNVDDEEQNNALKNIGIGLLAIIASPFAVAGAAIWSAGMIVAGVGIVTGSILGGIGSMLKGAGKAGKDTLFPDLDEEST